MRRSAAEAIDDTFDTALQLDPIAVGGNELGEQVRELEKLRIERRAESPDSLRDATERQRGDLIWVKSPRRESRGYHPSARRNSGRCVRPLHSRGFGGLTRQTRRAQFDCVRAMTCRERYA